MKYVIQFPLTELGAHERTYEDVHIDIIINILDTDISKVHITPMIDSKLFKGYFYTIGTSIEYWMNRFTEDWEKDNRNIINSIIEILGESAQTTNMNDKEWLSLSTDLYNRIWTLKI